MSHDGADYVNMKDQQGSTKGVAQKRDAMARPVALVLFRCTNSRSTSMRLTTGMWLWVKGRQG